MTETAGPSSASRRRSGTLHGRQQGRRLRQSQQQAMARLLPTHTIDLTRALDPANLFDRPVDGLRMEIGFGGGEHLAAQALLNPSVGFIGCEPFRNGVASLLQRIEGRGCDNLLLHIGDAGEVIDRLPDAALSRVDLLYPDPWPKRRQRKRRFVSDAMLVRLARAMKPEAEFRFATDIDDYAAWTLARILASRDFRWNATRSAQWREPWESWIETRYEAKARLERRVPVYLTFVRQ